MPVLRSALEDRPEEVAKIRRAARGLIGDLLESAVQPRSRDREMQSASEMKSAAPSDDSSTTVLGFLGCGVIARQVVTGLCRYSSADLRIVVSPRNAAIASALAERWPESVEIALSNQAVVDAASVVCVGVLPTDCNDVLRSLRFRHEQTVLSFVSTSKIADLSSAVFPATRVVRAIPMPPISEGRGPLPMFPRDDKLSAIFDEVGVVIVLDDEVVEADGVVDADGPAHGSTLG